MADIGCLPTRTHIEITSTTGGKGRLDAATPRAAGCMTAAHAEQLEALWARHLTGEDGGGASVLPPDVVTRGELQALIRQMPAARDLEPAVAQMRREMERLAGATLVALPAPERETIDAKAREVLGQLIESMRALDERLRRVESHLAIVAEVAEQQAARAAA